MKKVIREFFITMTDTNLAENEVTTTTKSFKGDALTSPDQELIIWIKSQEKDPLDE